MEAYQQRVVDEKKELDERLGKLADFLWTPTFKALPGPERFRLIAQSELMQQLSMILGQRIAAFNVEPKVERAEDVERRAMMQRIKDLEQQLFDAYDEQTSTYLTATERQELQHLLNARTRRMLDSINIAAGAMISVSERGRLD